MMRLDLSLTSLINVLGRFMDRNSILKGVELPKEYEENLKVLLERVNKLSVNLKVDFKVTSGFRTMESHLAIYAKKGITDKSKIPMKSKHLYCQAVDLYDADGNLKKLVKADKYKELIECDLYMEHEDDTPNWLHLQIVAPSSGKREFKP